MEDVIVYDRLKDIDNLSRLLGRDMLGEVELVCLDDKSVNHSNREVSRLLNSIRLVIKFKCTESDLEALDKYYECPLKYHRTAILFRGSTCWIYYKNANNLFN